MLRSTFLAALGLLLVQSGSALASNPYSKNAVFGTAYCPQTFSCAVLKNSEMARAIVNDLVSVANGCVRGNFNMKDSDGYFEKSFGLDSDSCLKTKKIKPEKEGLTMTPHCCVQPSSGNPNACRVVCVRYGVR